MENECLSVSSTVDFPLKPSALLQLPSQVGAKLQRSYPFDMIGETYHIPMIVCTFAIHFRRLKSSHPQKY